MKMNTINKYLIEDTSTIKDALKSLNSLSSGSLVLFIIDKEQRIIGSLTDGDIRRGLLKDKEIYDCVLDFMNPNFKYLTLSTPLETVKEYKEKNIKVLPLLDEDFHLIKIVDLSKRKSLLPIDAVLMAGGKGERLRPLTENTPKPLIQLGNKPIIDHNIDRLISYGIENINVTVNYLGEQIEQHFTEPRNNIHIKTVREPQYLGTIGSIKFVTEFHNDTILVMNSDLFTNINYEDFYLHFKEHDADMSVAAVPYNVNIPFGIFDLDGRCIKGIKEKPAYHYYANAGIYLFKSSMLDFIPNNKFFNATDFIDELIQKNKKVIRFPITGYWIDIGRHEEYNKAKELVKHIND